MIRVETYFAAHDDRAIRFRVVQDFPKSAITDGHTVVLRHNFTERVSAARYAKRVEAVGFQYA